MMTLVSTIITTVTTTVVTIQSSLMSAVEDCLVSQDDRITRIDEGGQAGLELHAVDEELQVGRRQSQGGDDCIVTLHSLQSPHSH